MTVSARESRTANDQPVAEPQAATFLTTWQPLYRIAGTAALVIAVLIPIAVSVFVIWPPPFDGGVIDWFMLFQQNWLLGLVSLDLVFMAVWALQVPIFLALYGALRRASESLMALATALAFVGVAVYFASNTAFEMLDLSQGYAAATTDAQRSTYLAAGAAMLAVFQGTAFKVSYLLASLAGVMIAVVMLRTSLFGHSTAYTRLLASVLGLGLFVPTVGVFLGLLSVVFEWIWFVLIGRRLVQLASGVSNKAANRR